MVDYPNNAPAGSTQANTAMPGYGPRLQSGFSYAAGLADAVRNAANFFGNIFSFGTLGGSSPSTSSSPTAAPTATTSPTSTTTPGATTPREAAAARTGPPVQPTYSVTGTAGKIGTTTAAPAPITGTVAPGTVAPNEKPGAGAMSAMGYAAGLGVSPPSSGIGEAKAPVDVSNFTDTRFGNATDFTAAPAAAVPGEGVEAAHAAGEVEKAATAPLPGATDLTSFEDPFASGKLNPVVAQKYAGKTGYGVPVTIRNNNPSAMSITGADVKNPAGSYSGKMPGFVGTSPRPPSEKGLYAKYATPEAGVAAASKNLERYGAQGINTPAKIAVTWAQVPGADYAPMLANALGIGVNDVIDLSNPDTRAKLLMAQSAKESGAGVPVYRPEVYYAGANYQLGGSRFGGAPGAVDPFANATTYGAGGPATGGAFERDPNGNPVPPANIPGGAMPAAPGGIDYSIPGAGFVTGAAPAEAIAAPAAAKPAAAPAAAAKQPSLKVGASGPAVRDLQTQLLAAGFNPGPIDGRFGPQTKAALTRFQRDNPGTGNRRGRPDAIAGPRTQAALPAANPYRDIQPPEDIVVQPPDGYAAGLTPAAFDERFGPTPAPGITPAAFDERFGPTMAPAAAAPPLGGTQVFGPGQTGERAPQPSAGPNFDETFNAPTPLPGQELTPEQGADTMATRADLRDRLPGAAATAGAGYYRGLQSAEEDRASRARLPETIASTYAAITGGGGTDQFAGGPAGGIPPPPPSFATNPAAVGANIGSASAAAPPAASGYVPTPYRDPGLVSPDEAARARADFERLKGGAGTAALGGGAGEDQLREPGSLYPGEWPLSGAARAAGQTVPGLIQREPELNLPPEGYNPRPAPMRQLLDRGIGRQALIGGAGTSGLAGGPRSDQLRDRGYVLSPKEWPLSGAAETAGKVVPGNIQRAPEFQLPDEDYRPTSEPEIQKQRFEEQAALGAAALTAPEPDVVRTLASLPPEGQAQYRGGFANNILDSIDQAGDARGILKAIDASPQASRRLEVVLGAQGASQFKSLVRVDGIGNREPGTRFAAALPSMAGLRGSPPVDSQVAARVGALLDSEDPAEFSRGLKIVAANPSLQALVQRVDAMV